MHNNARVLLVCLSLMSAAGGYAQTSSSSADDVPKGGYVRRFSGGISLGVLGMPFVKNNTTDSVSGSITNTYNTSNSSRRIGFGVTGQVALTDHIAINVAALVHRVGFQFVTTTDTSITSGGLTYITTTRSHEDTRANVYEFPVTVRYYFRDRFSKGPHAFVEGGAALMKASNARSDLDTTNAAGTTSCCTSINPDIANRTVRGFVAGAGVQIIDPIGIRLVPEVRYTHWQSQMFQGLSTITQKNQIEAIISLGF